MTGTATDNTTTATGRASKKSVDKASRHASTRRRRRRIIATAVTFIVVVLIGGGTALGIYETRKKPAYPAPKHTTATNDGILAAGTGTVRVDIYQDFGCRGCAAMAASAVPVLDKLLAANTITLIYHPIAAPDATTTNAGTNGTGTAKGTAKGTGGHASTTDGETAAAYATRLGSSVACAADYGYVLPYIRQLLSRESTPGTGAALTDDQLVQIGGDAGMIDPHFAQCVRAQTYRAWVAHVTGKATVKHIAVAPTILVDGRSIAAAGATPTVTQLRAAVSAAT